MFNQLIIILSVSIVLEIMLQKMWTAKMHKMKIEQVTKEYGPCWHEKTKMGTPTMGGIVYIPVIAAAALLI